MSTKTHDISIKKASIYWLLLSHFAMTNQARLCNDHVGVDNIQHY